MKEKRLVSPLDLMRIDQAIEDLKSARELLKRAGASNAVDMVRRALKSAEGAGRHAQGLRARQTTTEVLPAAVKWSDEELRELSARVGGTQ